MVPTDLEPGRGAFPGAEELLDIWHAAEHLADGAKAACGAGEEAGRQAERGKLRLLADGYCGVVEWVGELTATGRWAATGPHWAGS